MANVPDHDTEARPGIGAALLGLLVGIVTSNLVAVVLLVALDHENTTELPMWALLPVQVGLWVPMLLVPHLAVAPKGGRLLPAGSLRVTRREGLQAAAAGVALQVVVIPLVYLPILRLLDDADLSEPARELTDQAGGPVGVASLVLITVVGAPVVEEVFHRGIVQPSLTARFGVGLGILATSLLFAATHLQALQFPALTIFGLAVGWLAHRCGRVGPPIVMHVAFNATALVALAVTG